MLRQLVKQYAVYLVSTASAWLNMGTLLKSVGSVLLISSGSKADLKAVVDMRAIDSRLSDRTQAWPDCYVELS